MAANVNDSGAPSQIGSGRRSAGIAAGLRLGVHGHGGDRLHRLVLDELSDAAALD